MRSDSRYQRPQCRLKAMLDRLDSARNSGRPDQAHPDLEEDGASWRTIPSRSTSLVRGGARWCAQANPCGPGQFQEPPLHWPSDRHDRPSHRRLRRAHDRDRLGFTGGRHHRGAYLHGDPGAPGPGTECGLALSDACRRAARRRPADPR